MGRIDEILAKQKELAVELELAQFYNGAVSRLNNASFGAKSHTFGSDNGV